MEPIHVLPIVRWIWAPALAAGALLMGPATARADEPALALLPLEIAGNVPAGRAALESAAAKGAAAAGQAVVPGDVVAAKLAAASVSGACDSAPCWATAGRVAGARFLILGSVEAKDGLFQARFKVVQAAGGAVVGSEESRCEADDCSVAELCRLTAREAVRQAMGRPGETPPLAAAATSVAQASAPEAVVGDLRVTAQSAQPAPSPRLTLDRLWPPMAIGLGLAGAAAGAFLIKLDGDCIDEPFDVEIDGRRMRMCDEMQDTLWAGIATVGAGAALTAVGAVFTLRQWRRERAGATAALSVGPGHLGLYGRF